MKCWKLCTTQTKVPFIITVSVSSSDNEIDDIPVADAIINDDSGDERKYFTEISGGRLRTITQDTEKCSVVILEPEMVQKI